MPTYEMFFEGLGPNMAHHLLGCVRSGPGNIKAVRFRVDEFGHVASDRLLWESADATAGLMRRYLMGRK